MHHKKKWYCILVVFSFLCLSGCAPDDKGSIASSEISATEQAGTSGTEETMVAIETIESSIDSSLLSDGFMITEKEPEFIEIHVPYKEMAETLTGKTNIVATYSPKAYYDEVLYLVLSCSDSNMTQFPNMGEYVVKLETSTGVYEAVSYLEPGGMINKAATCGDYLFWVVNANAEGSWQIFRHSLKDNVTDVFAASEEDVTYSGSTVIAGSEEYFTYCEYIGKDSFKLHVYSMEDKKEYIYTEKDLNIINPYRLPDISNGSILNIVSQYDPADIEIIDMKQGSIQWETEVASAFEYGYINNQGFLMYGSDYSNNDIWLVNTESGECEKLFSAEEDDYQLRKADDKFVVYSSQASKLEIIDTERMTRTVYPLQNLHGLPDISGEYLMYPDSNLCKILRLTAITDDVRNTQSDLDEDNKLSVMNYVLREGILTGEFDIFLGQGGGIPLLNSEDEKVGVVEIHESTKSHFEAGKLVRITNPDNHSSFDSEWEELSTKTQGIFAEYSRDFGENREWWYAFWSEEDKIPVYAVALYKEYWTYEQALNLFNSVSFSDKAFIGVGMESQNEVNTQYAK